MTPTQQLVATLEADAEEVVAALTDLHHTLEEGRQEEISAWYKIEAAQAKQTRAYRQIEVQLEALANLRREIADQLPHPRPPVD